MEQKLISDYETIHTDIEFKTPTSIDHRYFNSLSPVEQDCLLVFGIPHPVVETTTRPVGNPSPVTRQDIENIFLLKFGPDYNKKFVSVKKKKSRRKKK